MNLAGESYGEYQNEQSSNDHRSDDQSALFIRVAVAEMVVPSIAVANDFYLFVLQRRIGPGVDIVKGKFLLPFRYERAKRLLSLTGNHTDLASRHKLFHLLLNLSGMSRENR
jgi:hypothetical protein